MEAQDVKIPGHSSLMEASLVDQDGAGGPWKTVHGILPYIISHSIQINVYFFALDGLLLDPDVNIRAYRGLMCSTSHGIDLMYVPSSELCGKEVNSGQPSIR